MHDIVRFHRTHGSAIRLSDDKSVATRNDDFANAVVFSTQPIKIGQKVCVELTQSAEWIGVIRVGVTSHDPAKMSAASLPRYVCPDLTRKEGFWAKSLDECYAETGCRLTFCLTCAGQIVYYVNKHNCGVFISGLPTTTQLWLVIDVFGNTTTVKFVPAEEVPLEIRAHGPEALQTYHASCEAGTQAMFRTRLMLVGQQGVGKTALKNALLGRTHQVAEERIGTIDLSASCSFSLRDRTAWKLINTGERLHIVNEDQDPDHMTGSMSSLEDDYHTAVAANLALELLYQNKRHRSQGDEKGTGKAVRGSSGKLRRSSTARDKRTREATPQEDNVVVPGSVRSRLPADTPERVVRLVEEMLRRRELGSSQSAPPGGKGKKQSQPSHNVQLNIWDFAGRSLYYITHQVFLTARAVYVIVFDLSEDLDAVRPNTQADGEMGALSGLDYIDYWLNTIHVHTARNTHSGPANVTLSPSIFIVGTHRHALHRDDDTRHQMVKAKFDQINEMTTNKAYERHIVKGCYAVECGLEDGEDMEVGALRRHLEDVASREPYMGEQIPVRWLRFECAVAELVETGTDFVTLSQLQAVATGENIAADGEFHTMLQFYHDLGLIVYYGGTQHCDPVLRGTVILRPEWLIVVFSCILFARPDTDKQGDDDRAMWQRLETSGLMEEQLIGQVCPQFAVQKDALLKLMEKFDLICERLPRKHTTPRAGAKHGRCFYVPSRLTNLHTPAKLFTPSDNDIVFYIDFKGFLPGGLFQRLLTRVIRWSLERGGHEPLLSYHQARCFLNAEHDLALQMAPLHMARIKVTILRAACLDSSDDTSSESSLDKLPPPSASAAAKVRRFLEVTLTDYRNKWIQHLSYRMCVQCCCGWPCETHNAVQCSHDQCLHFLNLDECIANKIVCCEHRRVKTSRYRKWFPVPKPIFKKGPILDAAVLKGIEATQGNIESRHGPELPGWLKGIAKLLNGGSVGQDWTALAYNLGYTKAKLDKFNEDLNPSLAMVTDWIISSGNTPLSVDMMVGSLDLMQRDDIIEVIQKGRESEVEPAQVFLSYQWDIQDEVRTLRNKLEAAGFTCWMDIGQMGGGDQLYGKIDAAIRGCKVAVACISPKYIVSQLCMKEVGLADLLRKPIIPILYSKVPWPPPGGMALTFSQLVYININGVGGHGGSGIHADLAEKHQEIIQRVSCYASTAPVDVPESSPRRPRSERSSASLHSAGSVPDAPIPIAGYASDYSPPSRRVVAPSRQRTAPSSGHSHEVPVEQVHITKCTVCVIL